MESPSDIASVIAAGIKMMCYVVVGYCVLVMKGILWQSIGCCACVENTIYTCSVENIPPHPIGSFLRGQPLGLLLIKTCWDISFVPRLSCMLGNEASCSSSPDQIRVCPADASGIQKPPQFGY